MKIATVLSRLKAGIESGPPLRRAAYAWVGVAALVLVFQIPFVLLGRETLANALVRSAVGALGVAVVAFLIAVAESNGGGGGRR